MTFSKKRALVAALLGSFGFCACSGSDTPASQQVAATESAVTAVAAADEQITVELRLPGPAKIADTVVSGEKGLKIEHRAHVGGELASVDGAIHVDEGAHVGGIIAAGDVHVRSHAHVTGDILTAGTARIAHSARVGKVTSHASLGTPTSIKWTATRSATSAGSMDIGSDQSSALDPGTYGNLQVGSGGKVTLRTGNYFFDDVMLHHHSKVVVDHRNGPVVVYVSGRLKDMGQVQAVDSAALQLMVVVLGEEPVKLRMPFSGVVVAPKAHVEVDHPEHHRPEHHQGVIRAQVFAKTVSVEDEVVIESGSFDWPRLIGSVAGIDYDSDPTRTTRNWPAPRITIPIDVPTGATQPVSTSSSSSTPVCFTLRPWFSTSRGGIANGTFEIGFVDSKGAKQSCLYRGQSSVSNPTTAADFRLARELRLESCTNGQVAGDQICTTSATGVLTPPGVLTPTGNPYPVSVNMPVDDTACTGRFEFYSPSETQAMLGSFDWSKATQVDAGPSDRPAVYYASVFIRNKEELKALKKLSIHMLRRPLFSSELAAYAGQCGIFTTPGTGAGFFVPVLIPGITYNKLIEAFTSPDVDPNQREIFQAVILRGVPDGARESNGSVILEALAAAHIQWDDDAVSAVETVDLPGGDVAKVFASAMEWVGNAVRDVGQVVTNVLGDLQKLFTGSVDVDMTVRALNLNLDFDSTLPMARAWGTGGGKPIGVAGMHITILEDLFGTFIPTTATGNTDSQGHVRISAPQVGSGGVRGSGVCMRMESRGSEITGFLISDDVCDFRGFDANRANVSSNFSIPDFEHDSTIALYVSNGEVSGFFQAEDSWQYDARVVGHYPKQARILMGFWANTFAQNSRSYAPCLSFGSSIGDAAFGAALELWAVVPYVGAVLSAFIAILEQTDIVLTDDNVKDSRWVASHEYGHFTFCSMMAETKGGGAVDGLIWKYIFGNDNSSNRYINEAFAEYLTGQVASAADYKWLPAEGSDRTNSVCLRKQATDSAGQAYTPSCFDSNLRQNAMMEDNIGRLATMLHDVFDGQGGHGADLPNDADAWEKNSNGIIVYTGNAWGSTDSSASDSVHPSHGALESVALPGPAFTLFAQYFGMNVNWMGIDTDVTDDNWVRSLNGAMEAYGVNWCQRCLLLALHSTSNPGNGVQERFNACQADSLLSGALGSPPAELHYLDVSTCAACAGGYYSNANGECTPCSSDPSQCTPMGG